MAETAKILLRTMEEVREAVRESWDLSDPSTPSLHAMIRFQKTYELSDDVKVELVIHALRVIPSGTRREREMLSGYGLRALFEGRPLNEW